MPSRKPIQVITMADRPDWRADRADRELAQSRAIASYTRRIRCGGGYRVIRKRIPSH